MNWELRYWGAEKNNPVENWLDGLNNEQAKCVSKELKLLARCGSNLRLPHSKSLGQGLFELREQRYGFRIYYGFMKNCVIMLVAGGNKSTQERDIKIARLRLESLKNTAEKYP